MKVSILVHYIRYRKQEKISVTSIRHSITFITRFELGNVIFSFFFATDFFHPESIYHFTMCEIRCSIHISPIISARSHSLLSVLGAPFWEHSFHFDELVTHFVAVSLGFVLSAVFVSCFFSFLYPWYFCLVFREFSFEFYFLSLDFVSHFSIYFRMHLLLLTSRSLVLLLVDCDSYSSFFVHSIPSIFPQPSSVPHGIAFRYI